MSVNRSVYQVEIHKVSNTPRRLLCAMSQLLPPYTITYKDNLILTSEFLEASWEDEIPAFEDLSLERRK
jgi:hypothetical protein